MMYKIKEILGFVNEVMLAPITMYHVIIMIAGFFIGMGLALL